MKIKNYINGEFFETENYLDAIDPSNLDVIGKGNKLSSSVPKFEKFYC